MAAKPIKYATLIQALLEVPMEVRLSLMDVDLLELPIPHVSYPIVPAIASPTSFEGITH